MSSALYRPQEHTENASQVEVPVLPNLYNAQQTLTEHLYVLAWFA